MEDNELALFRRAAAGDVNAQEALFAGRIDGLTRLAYLITRDHSAAQDVMQDALIASIRHLDSLREAQRFDAWLSRIVVNHARTYCRKAGRSVPMEDLSLLPRVEENGAAIPSPEESILRNEQARRLAEMISRLPEKHRLPVLLMYYQGMSEREIASALALPSTTIKSRLHAARKRLRTMIEREEKYGRLQ